MHTRSFLASSAFQCLQKHKANMRKNSKIKNHTRKQQGRKVLIFTSNEQFNYKYYNLRENKIENVNESFT